MWEKNINKNGKVVISSAQLLNLYQKGVGGVVWDDMLGTNY